MYVRLFLNGAVKIVHTAPWPHYTKMSLATAGIYCTISPPLSGAMEDRSIVRVQQLQISIAEGAVYPRHDSQRMWRFSVSDKAGYLDNFYVRQNGQICPTSQRFSDKNAGSVRKIQICPTEKSDVPDKSRYVPQSTKRPKLFDNCTLCPIKKPDISVRRNPIVVKIGGSV